MKSRFAGDAGRSVLVEALKKQEIVEYHEELAHRLAEHGEVVEFAAGDALITQDSADNDVFFLLAGDADVFVNERHVATRSAGTTVGEMAALDSSAARAATVTAKNTVVALRVSEQKFREVLESFPRAYKALCTVVCTRLRHRAAFHRPPNPQPILFLGCSAEALEIAQGIQLGLQHAKVEVRIWTDGIFGPSNVTIDALMEQVDLADFAAFVIAPDDRVVSRHKQAEAPRDNVVFELGMFMGRLERRRVYLVKDKDEDVKIPTDLLGVTPINYVKNASGNVAAMVGPVCTQLRTEIKKLGVR